MPSKGVSLAKLEELYQKAVKLSGFVEKCQDPVKDRWSRQIEPGIFDLRITHGFYNDQPATMQVGIKEILSESDEHLWKQYSSSGLAGAVYIPKILFSIKCEEREPYFCLIQEKFQDHGAPFLPRFPFSNSQQKKDIADLYWKTVESFSEMCRRDEKVAITMAKNEGQFSSLYFSRLNRWLDMGENAWQKSTGTKGEKQREKEQYGQDRKVVTKIIKGLKETDVVEMAALSLSPELFFRHFGYTDMVYCANTGQFGLPMSQMGVFPQYYGATYWVWNVLMHSYGQSSDWAMQEVKKWHKAFEPSDIISWPYMPSKFNLGFNLNLLERVAAALLCDLPLERNPFDQKQDRIEKARIIFRAVLENLRKVLPD